MKRLHNTFTPLFGEIIMSTKIFNGLILRDYTLDQALPLLIKARQQFLVLMKERVSKVFARKLAFRKDLLLNFSTLDRASHRNIYMSLMDEVFQAEKKVLGEKLRDPTWDATLEIVLIPHQNDLLAIYFAESVEGYFQALLDTGFEDFSYQNSTDDLPEGVSSEEWEERERRWNEVLGRSCIPGEMGFTYSLVSWNDIGVATMDRALMLSSFPDENARRFRVALELCEHEYTLKKGESLLAASRTIKAQAQLRANSIVLCSPEDLHVI